MELFNHSRYDTDKGVNYLRYYEHFFRPLRNQPVNLLELGIHRGGSLRMWRDYFPLGKIIGVDLAPPQMEPVTRLHTFAGDASDPETFQRIEQQTGCSSFDIIIDDASHVGSISKKSFELLYVERLAKGGIYVIEDWGTGYRDGWPDGEAFKPMEMMLEGADPKYRFKTHDYGMVGWVKSMVDVMGQADIRAGGGAIDAPVIDLVSVAPGLVFLSKPR
ncbi:conserved hypothetical protein [uncultured Defluviicoccus sp.]|uniref:Ribosomal RNA methyltransferase FtsJ domain-containing protein n=1 Tax=metagenome TaxID=256318 RepID=A0A380TEA8_9ZZZZ|nr:conserved hypothetical protein [uncultured Defluviicoccus sp.]